MKKLALLYSIVALFGLLGAAALVVSVYRTGSAPLPTWREAVSPGALSAPHAFLADACESCHTPNRGIEAASCITCHATNQTVLANPSTAFHASIGDCRGCHVEHQGAAMTPTRMDHDRLAEAARHRAAWITGDSVWRRVVAHVTAEPERLVVANTGGLDCAECHANRDPHRELFGQACADCHGTQSWSVAEFKHPSPRSQDCAQCHQAPPSHYMEHFTMVSKRVAGVEHATVTQCSLCHRSDSWNDIKGIGWYKHH
ncbi:MAG: class III cytochrome C family protein [Alphaproteobacteria bacterium]